MTLAFQIDSLDGLDDSVKSLYQEGDDGKFTLGIDGLPNIDEYKTQITSLNSKVSALLDEKKEAAKKAKEAEEASRKAADEAARKNGDVEALETSWREKFSNRETELSEQITTLQGSITDILVNKESSAASHDWAIQGSAAVLEPHIRARLKVEEKDGKHVTRILDAEGKPSAMTMDDLKGEFLKNQAFAPIMAGSRASGGGASSSQGGGGKGKTVTRSQFQQMDAAERMKFAKAGGQVIDA